MSISPNLLWEAEMPVRLNRMWVADIAYLRSKENGFVYLAGLMDLCSRRVVGWEIDSQMSASRRRLLHLGVSQPSIGNSPFKKLKSCCSIPDSPQCHHFLLCRGWLPCFSLKVLRLTCFWKSAHRSPCTAKVLPRVRYQWRK